MPSHRPAARLPRLCLPPHKSHSPTIAPLAALTVLSAFLCLASFASPSHAGTWTKSVTPTPLPNGSVSGDVSSPIYGPGSASATPNYHSGPHPPCGASASAQVTVTFTWTPAAGQTSVTDPPPPQVIAHESASGTAQYLYATAMPPQNPTPPGHHFIAADRRNEAEEGIAGSDALSLVSVNLVSIASAVPVIPAAEELVAALLQDAPVSDTLTVDIGDFGMSHAVPPQDTVTASGEKWEVKDSTSGSVTITSPNLSATATETSDGGGTIAASIAFDADITSVRLKLDGTHKDDALHDHILIGQGASASLVLGDGSNAHTAFGNAFYGDQFSWDVTGDTNTDL